MGNSIMPSKIFLRLHIKEIQNLLIDRLSSLVLVGLYSKKRRQYNLSVIVAGKAYGKYSSHKWMIGMFPFTLPVYFKRSQYLVLKFQANYHNLN